MSFSLISLLIWLASGEIEAKLVFAYESLTVASQEELDNLPFASDFRMEQKVFQTLLQAGFEAEFESRRPVFTASGCLYFLYSYHGKVPLLRKSRD